MDNSTQNNLKKIKYASKTKLVLLFLQSSSWSLKIALKR